MAHHVGDVRVEETLRIKLGEAKNLPTQHGHRDTYCKVTFDQEQIFVTATVEKSLNPFYGEEFKCEIPRKFRFLSFYVCEKSNKPEKVIGKVSLKKEDLHRYHGKDHWFPLRPVDANSEVQGKAHIEVRFDEYISHSNPNLRKHRMAVRVLECNDLTVINGACNPYAAVTLIRGRTSKSKEDVKRTTVRKKTICPTFDETFFFELDQKGDRGDGNLSLKQLGNLEISVSIWHDDSRVSREIIGSMFPGSFLGEVRLPLKDLLDTNRIHRAWYFLQPRDLCRNAEANLGSLRVKISYAADHVFSTHYYHELRKLLLDLPNVKPVTSSVGYILGEIVMSKEEAAQPLVRVFHESGQVVQLISALADWEISKTTDPNTIFRGNTLASKCVDELMKLVGQHYLQDTLKTTIDKIFDEHKSCEIDPTRLKDGENIETNMAHLEGYVQQIFESVVYSGLHCPDTMCEVFYALKEAALKHFPDLCEVRYQVVSGFVFLRFFAPAILGPCLFNLRSGMPDVTTHRTLTLISKTIQSLGNTVCAKSHAFGFKEEYMLPVFKKFTDRQHMDAIKSFLDIISSLTRMYSTSIEAPVTLKEGHLIKRAQGRRKFGLKNFKQRYFQLTNFGLSYFKAKGSYPLCEIPIYDILAVETLQEQTFTKKNMFQVVQPRRALYIQADNCVNEKEWKDILSKVCNMNKNRLRVFHPAAYLKGHWLCCKSGNSNAPGCTPVTSFLPPDIKFDLDTDREMEKIHSLFFNNIEKLESLQDACASQEVYSGDNVQQAIQIEDTKTCFETINTILKCIITLEQEHKQYLKMMEKRTIIGSQEFPFGDDGYAKSMSIRL